MAFWAAGDNMNCCPVRRGKCFPAALDEISANTSRSSRTTCTGNRSFSQGLAGQPAQETGHSHKAKWPVIGTTTK